jgi:phosphoenolpyruvate synthase/pyruvate phosphate dikinase
MKLKFLTKARTLSQLNGQIKSALIPKNFYYSFKQWRRDSKKCIKKILSEQNFTEFIVRSSSGTEDTSLQSNAGAFLSLLNITADGLEEAIGKVFESYGSPSDHDEVLIQPMVRNVQRSGVVFSHDPSSSSPYRVVNWHEGSDTTYVTSGRGGKRWIQAAASKVRPPSEIEGVIVLMEELIFLFGSIPIDFEFAISIDPEMGEILWLLQVRALVMKSPPESDFIQAQRLNDVEIKISKGMGEHPFLMGKRTVYGVMPDWNPAEILGIRPQPLALSLYKDLITDSTWAYQRHNYGYRNLRSFPLMLNFCGQPYIDVRVSFNSFVPADIDDLLAGKMVDYYVDRLLQRPALHDKVEFEIVYSCYSLDLSKRIERLREYGFKRAEIETVTSSLRRLTNKIIHPINGLWRQDSEKLNNLVKRRETILNSKEGALEKIYWLLEDGRRYGTLPFAGLARAGFIAIQLLNSLFEVGIFSKSDCDSFMGAISTVGKKLVQDRFAMDKQEFLLKYGHLRPGTYDILSPRYDEKPDLYFDWNTRSKSNREIEEFRPTDRQMEEINIHLKSHGLETDAFEMIRFIEAGIELREWAKFLFTRNLSDALVKLTEYGESFGYSKEEMAYLDISTIKELYVSSSNPKIILQKNIELGKERYRETSKLTLPPIITKCDDIWGFELAESEPNFVTQKSVYGSICGVDKLDQLSGSIVIIQNADPGFDWLFSHSIAGLITAWGGANSHMAIRAGELELPAAIGVGELMYSQLLNATKVYLDCSGRRLEVLK